MLLKHKDDVKRSQVETSDLQNKASETVTTAQNPAEPREDSAAEKISGPKGQSGEAAQENWDTGFDKAQNQGYSW